MDNDQEYYSQLYLDEKIRREFNIGLDHRCEIFQTFEGERNHVDLLYRGEYETDPPMMTKAKMFLFFRQRCCCLQP